MEHNWPGNVRELENVVERAVVLAWAPRAVDVLPDSLLQASGIRMNRGEGAPLPADASLFEIVNDFERRKILETGEVRLEPDGRRRESAHAAFHAESEDQAAGYQDQEEERGVRAEIRLGKLVAGRGTDNKAGAAGALAAAVGTKPIASGSD